VKLGPEISQEMSVAKYMVWLGRMEVLVMALHNRVFGLGLFLKGDCFPFWVSWGPEGFSSGHHVDWIWGRGQALPLVKPRFPQAIGFCSQCPLEYSKDKHEWFKRMSASFVNIR